MSETKQKCKVTGTEHVIQFVIAAHGYQCFACILCDYIDDVIEDSQP